MNNDDIAEKLQGIDLEPLTSTLRDEVETLLANDPEYFLDVDKNPVEDADKIVANLKAIIDLIEKAA
jgi:hypothetical protein